MDEAAQLHEKMLAMNEALLLGSLRQHELAEAADKLNEQLRAQIERGVSVPWDRIAPLLAIPHGTTYRAPAVLNKAAHRAGSNRSAVNRGMKSL